MPYPYLIYDQVVDERRWEPDVVAYGGHVDLSLLPPARVSEVPVTHPLSDDDEVPAATAGEQDHSDPWVFAGEDADPPADTGRPADG